MFASIAVSGVINNFVRICYVELYTFFFYSCKSASRLFKASRHIDSSFLFSNTANIRRLRHVQNFSMLRRSLAASVYFSAATGSGEHIYWTYANTQAGDQ